MDTHMHASFFSYFFYVVGVEACSHAQTKSSATTGFATILLELVCARKLYVAVC